MKPELVIALYRPHPGQERALDALVERHVPALREAELITGRDVLRGRSADGTVVEVFEWVSADAAARAHELPAVASVWEAMAQVADFVTLAELPEAGRRFPHFAALS